MTNATLRKLGIASILLLWASVGLLSHSVLPTDLQIYQHRYTETAAPPAPVRPVAEFEPSSAVLIRYPLGIPLNLVSMLSQDTQIICLVASSSQQNSASTSFANAGVDMNNVSFMVASTDSYWTRDYSPWFIVDGNDEFAVVDFIYNRPRPSDNQIPQLFAQNQSYPYYGMNIQQTGGNYMTDGISIAAQTTLVYNENTSQGPAGVNNKMQQYMGAETFYGIPDPNNTYIDHIDCWGKFLAPDKVLVRSVPTNHPQYQAIEGAAQYFATRNCSWGYPWKVYRVNTPQNQPYSNSLILNKKVYVPIMNSSYDAAALQVYRDALPGYEVIGILGAYSTPWESTDALHCRTHEINDRQMLYINHNPFWGLHDADNSFEFNVKIKAYSGQALYPDSLKVVYKINGGSWQQEILSSLGQNQFRAMLGNFAHGDTVRYFIHAADQSGRSLDHPFTGADDPHLFVINQDSQAPVIEHEAPVDIILSDSGPITFLARVTDNIAVDAVYFRYYSESMDQMTVPMNDLGDDMYSFDYYPEFGVDDYFLSYQIKAQDTANPPNISFFPSLSQWISIPLKVVATDDPMIPQAKFQIKNIFPNPLIKRGDKLNIEIESQSDDDLKWTIYNIRGQRISSGIACAPSRGDSSAFLRLNLLDYNIVKSGIYLLELSGKHGTSRKRFIIAN